MSRNKDIAKRKLLFYRSLTDKEKKSYNIDPEGFILKQEKKKLKKEKIKNDENKNDENKNEMLAFITNTFHWNRELYLIQNELEGNIKMVNMIDLLLKGGYEIDIKNEFIPMGTEITSIKLFFIPQINRFQIKISEPSHNIYDLKEVIKIIHKHIKILEHVVQYMTNDKMSKLSKKQRFIIMDTFFIKNDQKEQKIKKSENEMLAIITNTFHWNRELYLIQNELEENIKIVNMIYMLLEGGYEIDIKNEFISMGTEIISIKLFFISQINRFQIKISESTHNIYNLKEVIEIIHKHIKILEHVVQYMTKNNMLKELSKKQISIIMNTFPNINDKRKETAINGMKVYWNHGDSTNEIDDYLKSLQNMYKSDNNTIKIFLRSVKKNKKFDIVLNTIVLNLSTLNGISGLNIIIEVFSPENGINMRSIKFK